MIYFKGDVKVSTRVIVNSFYEKLELLDYDNLDFCYDSPLTTIIHILYFYKVISLC